MSPPASRAHWSTRLAFILAAAGSAVGLGNIWKFPYITGVNGGGAFVAVYLVCIAAVGLPIFIAELYIGQKAQANVVRAFEATHRPGSPWRFVGWMGLLSALLILSFYSVVGGWVLDFVYRSLTNQFAGHSDEEIKGVLGTLFSNPVRQLFWHALFMGGTVAIVLQGLKEGLERWNRILMPALFVLLLLLLGRTSDKWGHLLATLASWSTFVIGAAIAAQMWGAPEDARRFSETLFTWIPAGDLTVNFGLLVEPLSITFVILVTFVGSLIHVYAIAYMEHDEARRRFFAYLNLFIAAMLTLVLADNLVLLFVGWEGVGMASYLLIGFWYSDTAKAWAGRKAFVTNRIGDFAFLIATFLIVLLVSAFNTQATPANFSMVGGNPETAQVRFREGLAVSLAKVEKH